MITVAGFTAVLLVVMEIKARQDDLRINYYPPREDLGFTVAGVRRVA